MSNVNNPHGLKPLMRTQSGGAPQAEQMSKAVGYAYAIFKWDPVTEAAGVLNGPASGLTPGTTYYIGVALNWAPASVASNHQVIVSPDAIFEAQGDGSGGTDVVAAKMGWNANLNVASVAGGGVTRDNSGVQFVESTIGTGNLDLRLLQLLNSIDNAYGANARVELKFNRHLRTAGVTAT